jgi:DNA-binding beta-propeller fold protein YncE
MKLETFVFSTVLLLVSPCAMAASLTPGAPVELTGTTGKFDFIKMDAANRRLLVCHTGNGSLDVIDVDAGKLIKSISTGNAQGVAVDEKKGRYFVSASKPPKLVIIDSTKLEVIGEVPLPEAADVLAYDPKSNRAFVCDDEKPELWIIDPEVKKIVTTLMLSGAGMEDLAFNADASFLFQNLKESSLLAKIDLAAGRVVETWPTSPADKPHGLAMVEGANAVLIAGGAGKLALIDLGTGKIIASADIAPRVDEMAYDPGLKRAYCASGTGAISVVSVDADKLTTIDTVPSSQGAHSLAVDPKTHTVWIAYAKDNKPFVQPFTAAP